MFIGVAVILLYLSVGFLFLTILIPDLAIDGSVLKGGTIATLVVFLSLGALIILSTFSEIFFHILTVFEIQLFLVASFLSAYDALMIPTLVAVFAPQIFYYITRIVAAVSKGNRDQPLIP